MTYIIVTPVKNEENNLPNLIESMESQSSKPAVWVIIDDGSTDQSPKIIEKATSRFKWIKSIRLKESRRDLTVHVAFVIKTGFDFGVEYCKRNKLKFDYIGFLDADINIQDKDLYLKFINEFERDNRLGIAGGNLYDRNRRSDTISGGAMMCRREFFEGINGFPVSAGWDSVLRAKAILNKWNVSTFRDLKMIQTRTTGSAEGEKIGFCIKGSIDYYLGYNPILATSKGLKYCFEKLNLCGIIYLYCYFNNMIKRKGQINEANVRRYYYHDKPLEILKYYMNKLNRKE